MPEMTGTIPAVKERPKVAKRPTILAPPVPTGKERKTALKKAPAPVAAPPAVAVQAQVAVEASLATHPQAALALAAPVTPEAAAAAPAVKEGAKAAKSPAGRVSTIPPVKERPKVAKRPTIGVAATPAKKAILKPKPAAGEKAASPQVKEPAEPLNWINWAPLAVGIVLGFMAPQIHALAALWDPWGLRVVFPLVQLAGLHEIGLSDELTRTLPQLMLYLQFPLEGLLVAFNLRRGMRFSAAVGPVPALHFVCGLVLWIVALGSRPPI